MWAKCNLCSARILLPEDRTVIIDCLNNCQLDCTFELDYITYPHGEELQVWHIKEEGNEQ